MSSSFRLQGVITVEETGKLEFVCNGVLMGNYYGLCLGIYKLDYLPLGGFFHSKMVLSVLKIGQSDIVLLYSVLDYLFFSDQLRMGS